jgi:transposase
VALGEQGTTFTEAARWIGVSIRFANDRVRLRRETGSLAPNRQGNIGRGKLTGAKDRVQSHIATRPEFTINELTAKLATGHVLQVHRSSAGHLLNQLRLPPPSRPDLNPIKLVFAKLKALLRKAAARAHH